MQTKIKINNYNLKFFDKKEESDYKNFLFKETKFQTRIVLIISLILHIFISAKDIYTDKELNYLFWFAGAIIDLFIIFQIWYTSYEKGKYFIRELMLIITGVIPLITISFLMTIPAHAENFYYLSMMVVLIMWVIIFLGLRYINALIISTLFILLFELTVFYNYFNFDNILIIRGNIIIIPTFLLSISTSYLFEKQRKLNFCRLNLIERQNIKLTDYSKDLKEGEKGIRKIISEIPNLVISINKNSGIGFWNKKCEKVTGYKQEYVINNPEIIQELFPEKSYRKRILRNLISERLPVRKFETKITCKSGVKKIISWNKIEAYTYLSNNSNWFAGSDITESYETWKALQKSEHRLKEAQELAHIGSWDWNVATGKTLWSDEMYRMFGYNVKDKDFEVKRIFKKIINPDDLEYFKEQTGMALKNKRSISFEYTAILENGSERIMDVQGDVIVNEKGKVTRIFGTNQDITEIKQAESSLFKIRKSLEKAQEIANIGSLQYNFAKDEIFVSKEFFRIFEINKDIKITLPQTIEELIFEEDLKKSKLFFEKILSKKEPAKSEFKILTKNNSIKNISISTEITKNKERKANSLHIIFQDITERKEYEKKLREARLKAEESDRLKSSFLANMSHEIRTPMNAIVGFSNLLSDTDITDEERQEYSEYISSNSAALLTLINDIIDISKIEAREIIIQKKYKKLDVIFDNVYASISEQKKIFRKNNVKLIKELPENFKNISFLLDSVRLKQVLINLINNALKFTEKGHVIFGCKITSSNNIPALEFYVKDSGAGIKKENLNKIFNRFIKIDTEKNILQRGTGLGLTISQKLVKLMGGNIKVESELGKGSVFTFNLPYKTSETIFAMNKIKSKYPNFQHLNINILIAEDEFTNYKYLETILKKTKAKIFRAKNGMEAVDFIKNNPQINIILMDIRMPIMDGYEATKRIKKINPKIPIIAQTAYAMSEEKADIKKAGCDAYISKPINRNKLFKIIAKYVK